MIFKQPELSEALGDGEESRDWRSYVKFVRSSRYWARALDRLFPGRPKIGD